MKVKRFLAPDMRQAIRMVKAEQGPDAVILSNRKVEGGVEIISAVDYDEGLLIKYEPQTQSYADIADVQKTQPPQSAAPDAGEDAVQAGAETAPAVTPPAAPVDPVPEPAFIEMRQELKSLRDMLENQLSGLAWGELAKRNPLNAELLQRLMRLGLSATVCHQISGRMQISDDMEQLWQQALELLTHHIKVTQDDILQRAGLVSLVGPTGVGKTTTIAKLAARYALQHGSRNVALISADSFRIGAHEQLRRFGRILDIPVRNVSNRGELMAALDDFCDRDLVLIDTVGLGQRDKRIAEQADMLRSDNPLIRNYLVLASTARLSCMQEVARAYQVTNPQGCILTKLDEATSIGAALSVLIQNQIPAAYFTDGQRIPEDIHSATAATLVSRSVEVMQQHSPLLEDESLPLTLGRAFTNVYVGYKNR
jgi:flagellar biosynthesis protein FlhF